MASWAWQPHRQTTSHQLWRDFKLNINNKIYRSIFMLKQLLRWNISYIAIVKLVFVSVCPRVTTVETKFATVLSESFAHRFLSSKSPSIALAWAVSKWWSFITKKLHVPNNLFYLKINHVKQNVAKNLFYFYILSFLCGLPILTKSANQRIVMIRASYINNGLRQNHFTIL